MAGLTDNRRVLDPANLMDDAKTWSEETVACLRKDAIFRFWLAPAAQHPPPPEAARAEDPNYDRADPNDTYYRYNFLSGVIQTYVYVHDINPTNIHQPSKANHKKVIEAMEAVRSSGNYYVQMWMFFYAIWQEPQLARFLTTESKNTGAPPVDLERFYSFVANDLGRLVQQRLQRESRASLQNIALELITAYLTAGEKASIAPASARTGSTR